MARFFRGLAQPCPSQNRWDNEDDDHDRDDDDEILNLSGTRDLQRSKDISKQSDCRSGDFRFQADHPSGHNGAPFEFFDQPSPFEEIYQDTDSSVDGESSMMSTTSPPSSTAHSGPSSTTSFNDSSDVGSTSGSIVRSIAERFEPLRAEGIKKVSLSPKNQRSLRKKTSPSPKSTTRHVGVDDATTPGYTPISDYSSSSMAVSAKGAQSSELGVANADGATVRRKPRLLRGTSGSADMLFSAVAQLYSIHDFELTHIGSGFYGDVYKAVHFETEEVMVLKKNKFKGNAKFVLNEIELLHKLSHKNILRHLGACVEGGTLHPLTEFIDGGDLEHLLQGPEPLTWKSRINLCADITSGMSYLHSQNFLHRDLTSKNCLIRRPLYGPNDCSPLFGIQTYDYDVKDNDKDNYRLQAVICDYGLATKIPDPKCKVVKRLSIKGHPYWMSPECMTGKDYNQSSDVFSFGIILCEFLTRQEADPDILTRTHEFGLDADNLRRLIQKEQTPPPEQLVNLAILCCDLNPKARASFKDLTKILKDLIQNCQT